MSSSFHTFIPDWYHSTDYSFGLHTICQKSEARSDNERVPVVSVVDEHTVTITNIKVSLSGAGDSRERVRRYEADYTFDSSCPISHPLYASQEKVFNTIGVEVISSVCEGYSACVLAYGQSATGKTHTMMGTDAQPGLIPRLCKELYQRQPLHFTISFLEIYNERVHDLLSETAPLPCHSLPRRRGNARKDLRVREHPTRGPYVQNLRRVAVDNVEALLTLVEEGAKRRRTAATRRNSTSSRSHALLEIATPHATLHLADLAGSEKASWDGCGSGGRQKEGANINKSLVALSNVISALVSSGSGRGRFVPYRDSALTWLLRDCFTGGAKTFIIATLSPSVSCYGESASTLRWAARARQLPTPRTVLSGSHVPSLAVLQGQLRRLIAELTNNHIHYILETGKISIDEQYWLRKDEHASLNDTAKTDKIGNIMNALRQKADANNSESTASSVASGSSDVINTIDKNSEIAKAINKEVDKLFVPNLERTSSSDELKVIAPLRNKRRQYRSQEVLTNVESLNTQPSNSFSNTLPSKSDVKEKPKVPLITILHENQRAEIVASVTERLYSKLKKKEEAAVSKVESVVERKIMEPLSELKICTNARQRLVELSQKAIRNKRRIGIPAHTQTKKMVTRVRDQAIDVQTDLYSFIVKGNQPCTSLRDVATETISITPRCKEVCIGPTGSLKFSDKSTGTKVTVNKHSSMMTNIVNKDERCTQTQVVPPPRRKRRVGLSAKSVCSRRSKTPQDSTHIPIISINISQMYPESETQSSDENVEVSQEKSKSSGVMTPDLLTNHSTSDKQDILDSENETTNETIRVNEIRDVSTMVKQATSEIININDEFVEVDESLNLPRVSPLFVRKATSSEYKNMILGRNQDMYPYNIRLSPFKERNSKRVVKFREHETIQLKKVADDEIDPHNINAPNMPRPQDSTSDDTLSETYDPLVSYCQSINSDSTESSKPDTDSYSWHKGCGRTTASLRRNYVPVYKSTKYKSSSAKVLKDFLGLEEDQSVPYKCKDSSSENQDKEKDVDFKQAPKKKPDSQDKYEFNTGLSEYDTYETKLADSCNKLGNAVDRYEHYLTNYRETMKTRKPKEYLQHLVQIRRDVVKAESDLTDSSIDITCHK